MSNQPKSTASPAIDDYSFNLGVIAAFAEMVGVGAKKLALSHPLSPAEADALWAEAVAIAQRNGAQLFREPDLIVTDLFPAEVALGKHVLLIYTDDTLATYIALKQHKADLVASGAYHGAARREVAMRFGRLLSYPEAKIEARLQSA
ncbi:MAG: hypothetical protein KIH69_021585 [Anaerolineae bacterium]|nr:hypothetical protein [Anaerolineae bacterium]